MTRRSRLWAAAESRGIPLRAILTAAAVVVLVYVAAKVLYHLRDVILLVVVAYVVGYFTVQVGTSEKDSIWLRLANRVAHDVEQSGMQKAVAPFVPAKELVACPEAFV